MMLKYTSVPEFYDKERNSVRKPVSHTDGMTRYSPGNMIFYCLVHENTKILDEELRGLGYGTGIINGKNSCMWLWGNADKFCVTFPRPDKFDHLFDEVRHEFENKRNFNFR